MRTRAPWLSNRITANVATAGTDVPVRWSFTQGGSVDAGTGATVGATVTLVSGTLRAFALQTAATSVIRTHTEIGAGDLLLDLPGRPVVGVYDGQVVQSGTVPLAALSPYSPRFYWQGDWYAQKDVSESLAAAWAAVLNNQVLHQTILLRRVT